MHSDSKNPPGEDGGTPFPPPTGARWGGESSSPESFAAGTAKQTNGNGSAHDGKPNPAAAAFASLKASVEELKEYASYYLAAKSDGIKQSIKTVVLYAALGVLGLIVGTAILATAAVLLILGIGHGLATLFNSLWLGELVAGLLVLGGIGIGVWLMIKKITHNWKSELKKKYEERKTSQRSRFGHDVAERAQERKSPQSPN